MATAVISGPVKVLSTRAKWRAMYQAIFILSSAVAETATPGSLICGTAPQPAGAEPAIVPPGLRSD
jgi:hypothetical protein